MGSLALCSRPGVPAWASGKGRAIGGCAVNVDSVLNKDNKGRAAWGGSGASGGQGRLERGGLWGRNAGSVFY